MKTEKKLQSLAAFKEFAMSGETTRRINGGDWTQFTNAGNNAKDEKTWTGTSPADGGSGIYHNDGTKLCPNL